MSERKFKVGDRVAVSGTVVRVDPVTGDPIPYLVHLDEPDLPDNVIWFSEASLALLPPATVTEAADD